MTFILQKTKLMIFKLLQLKCKLTNVESEHEVFFFLLIKNLLFIVAFVAIYLPLITPEAQWAHNFNSASIESEGFNL